MSIAVCMRRLVISQDQYFLGIWDMLITRLVCFSHLLCFFQQIHYLFQYLLEESLSQYQVQKDFVGFCWRILCVLPSLWPCYVSEFSLKLLFVQDSSLHSSYFSQLWQQLRDQFQSILNELLIQDAALWYRLHQAPSYFSVQNDNMSSYFLSLNLKYPGFLMCVAAC